MNTAVTATSAGLPAQVLTSNDLFAQFLRFIDASAPTAKTYTRALRRFFQWLADRGIRQPKDDDVIAYRDALRATMKPTTTQLYMTAVRLFFRWTARQGIYRNIADHLKGARLTREHRKDPLSAAQAHKVLMLAKQDRSLTGLRNYALLAVMLTGGLRTIEAVRANVSDISTIGDDPVLWIQGKGHQEKDRYMHLEPQVLEALNAYLNARHAKTDEPLFASNANRNRDGRVTTKTISITIKQALVDAGYESARLTAHSTRHTAITLALMAGDSLDDVRQFAGHTNISTTEIYNHALTRAKSRCEHHIAEAIF